MARIPRAPKHLSAEARRIWRRVLREWQLGEAELLLLQQALEAYDRVQQAREILEREGLVVRTKKTGAHHMHPAYRIESDARAAMTRALRALNLKITELGG